MKSIRNDQGLSLVELIVVIAILGVVTTITAMSFNVVNRTNSGAAADTIDSYLEKVKSETMSKDSMCYLVLYKSKEKRYPGYYVGSTTKEAIPTYEETPKTDQRVSKKDAVIEVILCDGTTIDVENEDVFITFDRASGAVKTCFSGKNGKALTEKEVPQAIQITSGSRKSTIHLVKETGKHYVE